MNASGRFFWELLVVASQTIIVSGKSRFIFVSIKNFITFFSFLFETKILFERKFSICFERENDLLSQEHRKNQKPKAHQGPFGTNCTNRSRR